METGTQKAVSLKTVVQQKLVTNFSEVRTNSSGYPFITFLNGKKAVNIYFGKRSAEKVAVGMRLGADIDPTNAQIVLSTNAAGEERLKFSLNGESAYVAASDLFAVGPNTTEQEVLRAIAASMESAEEGAPRRDASNFDDTIGG